MPSDLSQIDALVLCGGLGKRLRATIGETQKVMAEVNSRPFLDIILEYIKKEGLRRVILCAGFQADKVKSYYQAKKTGLEIEFSVEKEPLGTGGAIKNTKSLVKSNPFFVFNGDSLCPVRLNDLLMFHNEHKALASVAISKVKDASDFGAISVDSTGKITAFDEKQKKSAGYVNAGIYCFAKNIFDVMPQTKIFSIEKDFFPLLTGKSFYGFETGEDFLDIGTPERYSQAKHNLGKEQVSGGSE